MPSVDKLFDYRPITAGDCGTIVGFWADDGLQYGMVVQPSKEHNPPEILRLSVALTPGPQQFDFVRTSADTRYLMFDSAVVRPIVSTLQKSHDANVLFNALHLLDDGDIVIAIIFNYDAIAVKLSDGSYTAVPNSALCFTSWEVGHISRDNEWSPLFDMALPVSG